MYQRSARAANPRGRDFGARRLQGRAKCADNQGVRVAIAFAGALALVGCGEALSSSDATPALVAQKSDLPAPIRALRVRVADEVAIVVDGSADSRLAEHLVSAVQAELGRLGIGVTRGTDKSADLTLRLETRVKGAVSYLRGHVALCAERAGVAVATVTTDDELHGEAEFPARMASKLVAALVDSPALVAFANERSTRVQPASPAPATAARPTPVPPATLARARYNRGTSFYNLGRYKEALVEYEAAYLAIQDPPFLYDIAQCHRKLGNNKEALGFYRNYLRVSPNAPNRPEVQKRIAELEREIRVAR